MDRTDERLAELAQRLESLAEELADLALDRLRTAAGSEDPTAQAAATADERRITRARRSVEKAAGLLGLPGGTGD